MYMTDKNGTNGERNIKNCYIYFEFLLIVSSLMKIKQLTYIFYLKCGQSLGLPTFYRLNQHFELL